MKKSQKGSWVPGTRRLSVRTDFWGFVIDESTRRKIARIVIMQVSGEKNALAMIQENLDRVAGIAKDVGQIFIIAESRKGAGG